MMVNFGSKPKINCNTVIDMVMMIGFLYFMMMAFTFIMESARFFTAKLSRDAEVNLLVLYQIVNELTCDDQAMCSIHFSCCCSQQVYANFQVVQFNLLCTNAAAHETLLNDAPMDVGYEIEFNG